jgi:hypothetical protein
MKTVAADRQTAMGALRAKATIIAQYRGFVSIKPSWSTFTYKVPETITVVTHKTDINADEAGVRAVTEMASASAHVPPSVAAFCAHRAHCSIDIPKFKEIAAKPIALCNGARGWLNAYRYGTGDVNEVVYARAGDMIYVARANYSPDTGDALHAAAAVATLCPKGVGEVLAPARAIPAAAPRGWTRGVGDLNDGTSDPYTTLAYWFYLPPASTAAHLLALFTASDVSEYVTPEQEAAANIAAAKQDDTTVRVQANHSVQLCGSDGWYAQFAGKDTRGIPYVEELLIGYGADTSYIARYTRDPAQPENPAAHKTLYSLCPPRSR